MCDVPPMTSKALQAIALAQTFFAVSDKFEKSQLQQALVINVSNNQIKVAQVHKLVVIWALIIETCPINQPLCCNIILHADIGF